MTPGPTVPQHLLESQAPPSLPVPPDGFRWGNLSAGPAGLLEALMSDRFPASHGFTCRVRNRRRDASPLGSRDDMEADLDLLERAAGVQAVHALRQVHGNDVHLVRRSTRSGAPAVGDAAVTRISGTAVAIKAADCVPVLLADPVSGAVAGAHAGWRGTLVRVVRKAAGTLAAEAGIPASQLKAVIGPAIRACCFEVGPEVVAAFRKDGHDVDRFQVRPDGSQRPHLDLPLANRLQLLEAGLQADSIEDTALCTRCQPMFHSYRREGPGVGRNWSVVVVSGG